MSGAIPKRRLVKQEQLRIAHQGPADGEHLLLAAREQPGALMQSARNGREQPDNLIEQLGAAPPIPPANAPDRRFSSTVRSANTCRPSRTWTMPFRTTPAGSARATSSPLYRIVPPDTRPP